jgi:hypothetical protein
MDKVTPRLFDVFKGNRDRATGKETHKIRWLGA